MKSEWESFEKVGVPRNAHETQRLETRRAFYAGALSMLSLVQRTGDPGVSEEDGVAILNAISGELLAFNEELRKGRA